MQATIVTPLSLSIATRLARFTLRLLLHVFLVVQVMLGASAVLNLGNFTIGGEDAAELAVEASGDVLPARRVLLRGVFVFRRPHFICLASGFIDWRISPFTMLSVRRLPL